MYEGSGSPVLSPGGFYCRVLLHLAASFVLLAFSLGLGMAGYMITEKLSAVDAFLNAAMLLGGMGPVNAPATTAGKLFAGVFALYAGLLFVVCAALVLTPVFHRVLHRFHVDQD